MSLAVTVGVPRAAVGWTPDEWQAALDRHALAIELGAFDPVGFCGFLPCTSGGRKAGFEYFQNPAAEFLADADHLWWWERLRLRRFGTIVELMARSLLDDRLCAVLAGATLAEMVGGLFLENSMGKWLSGKRALHWARDFAQRLESR